MAVWISQWLCPSRHCALAFAWDDRDPALTADRIAATGSRIFAERAINPWCGICREPVAVEHACSVFDTIEQATPFLEALAIANADGRRVLWERGAAQEPPWS